MTTREQAFLHFLKTGTFGRIESEMDEAILTEMLPQMWKLDGIPAPWNLFVYDNIEIGLANNRLDTVRISFKYDDDGTPYEEDVTTWSNAFHVSWYDYVCGMNVDAMRTLLEDHAIAYSCFYLVDDSVDIQIRDVCISMSFCHKIVRLKRYYQGKMIAWQGDSAVTKRIDFPDMS